MDMHLRRILPASALGLVALLCAGKAGAQATTSGAIQGSVTDEATSQPMLLVTVVASSPNLQGTQSEFTDASGQFFMSNLPPGAYSLLFIYGDSKVKRDNVEVGVGKTTVVNAKINTQASEVITVKERAPTIDAGSSKQGTTIEKDYIKNIPNRGRTWAGVLGAAGGAQGDQYGTSFSGSTSIENNYVVDGLNTSGITLGQGFPTQGSQVLNNFIQEIEVITGGYNAEFGRSTGGVVNVVTKTGSNEFHGSVFGNVNAFNANIEPIVTAGNSINLVNDSPVDVDFGFDLGGPIIKDKLWFYVGFAPTIRTQDRTRTTANQVDRKNNFFNYNSTTCTKNNDMTTCDGDGNPATNPSPNCEATGSCESDGNPDIDTATGFTQFEQVDSSKFQTHVYTYQFVSKLNLAVTPEHQGQVTFTGQPSTSLLISLQFPNGTLTATTLDRTELNTDVGLKWTSKFNDNKTQLDFIGGWHRYSQDNSPAFDSFANSPGGPNTTSALLVQGGGLDSLSKLGRNNDRNESDLTLAACNDVSEGGTDKFPLIPNCPETAFGYQLNSLIALQDTVEQRLAAKLTLTQRVTAAGHHQFKVGGDFEGNYLKSDRFYVNGSFYNNVGSTTWRRTRYIDLSPSGTDQCNVAGTAPCTFVNSLTLNSQTLNWGAFAQDSWSILPNLTLNAGIRYEQQRLAYPDRLRDELDPITFGNDMSIGQPIGTYAMTLTNLVAPRVGLIYDWTKEGRSKIYANWGRFYESIPMDINNREFGGETSVRQNFNVAPDPAGSGSRGFCGTAPTGANDPRLPTSPYNCPDQTTSARSSSIIGASPNDIWRAAPGVNALVMPGTGAQYLDEFVVGVEYEVLEDLRLGVSYQNRRIGSVIEDMSTDGANDYFVGNPGSFDSGEETAMLNQLHQLQMTDPTDPRIHALINRLNSFSAARKFDPAERVYNAVQFTASKRFSRAFMVQGSYTYSKVEGNYPGLFSPDTGQLDPNITSQYDLFELLGNRKGDLPFDRPHNFKLDGYYTFDLKDAGALTVGARFRAQSGVPVTPLAFHVFYGNIESYLNPRGIGGRTDLQVQADLHLAYSRKLGSMELSVFFELFNLFNNQVEDTVDQEYSIDAGDPVIGGNAKDLPYVKPVWSPLSSANLGATGSNTGGPNGALSDEVQLAKLPIVKKVNYGQALTRLAPLAGRIGATLSF